MTILETMEELAQTQLEDHKIKMSKKLQLDQLFDLVKRQGFQFLIEPGDHRPKEITNIQPLAVANKYTAIQLQQWMTGESQDTITYNR